MNFNVKEHIEEVLIKEGVASEFVNGLVVAAQIEGADYCLPCFKLSKALRKSPQAISEELISKFGGDEYFEKVESLNGYLNFTVNGKLYCRAALEEMSSAGETYGKSNEGEGKTVCIDYSSINIAKPFHIGHLSTTVIGAALYRIYKFLGYNAVGINHLGDYGTQFGKLISAFKRWGDRETIERGGVREMMKIYVKFHEEAEKDPSLNDEAREYFKQIEDKIPEAVALSDWFKNLTLTEVQKVYDKLNVKFDSYAGESFYNDKMDVVLDKLKEKNLLIESDGAKIVDLSEFNMPPCLILRSDGASLYATRDLATAIYRKNTYNFDKCLYVVAYQQNLHFKQFFKVLELMGYDWAKNMEHVAFGMVSLEGEGSLSTRKGNVVFLEDVIAKAVDKAESIIKEKSPDLTDVKETAEKVGTGAVVFSALINSRIKDIVFSYDKVLSFEGETGPYLQYTYARTCSLLGKAGQIGKPSYDKITPIEVELVKLLYTLPEVLTQVVAKNEPSILTRRLIDVAKCYNKFYFECRIIGEEEGIKSFRQTLTKVTNNVLKTGLELLGIAAPSKM